jgi:hypothetical protein
MSYLMFELQCPEARREEYYDFLRRNGLGIRKAAEYLLRALELMSPPGECSFHSVVFSLARHVAEEVDAISILVEKGCVDPCKGHLRSAFEADLGIRYILDSDSERRGLAYQVKELRERLHVVQTHDPKTPEGKKVREAIQDDPVGASVLALMPPYDFDAEAKRLNATLASKPWDTINAEWVAKGDKSRWHSLFDGPRNVRALALYLKRGFWYEFLYSDWSGRVHAGSALRNIGTNSKEPDRSGFAVRPLRHPDGLRHVYSFATGITLALAHLLSQRYLSQIGRDDLRKFYVEEVQPIYHSVKDVEIGADWR